jgi:hypothetical protein
VSFSVKVDLKAHGVTFMSASDSPRSSDFFDSAYGETPPWDIGAAQPDLIALFNEYPPAGPVLDLGCGTGDLALALARRGLTVLGIDLAEPPAFASRSRPWRWDRSPPRSSTTAAAISFKSHRSTEPGPWIYQLSHSLSTFPTQSCSGVDPGERRSTHLWG